MCERARSFVSSFCAVVRRCLKRNYYSSPPFVFHRTNRVYPFFHVNQNVHAELSRYNEGDTMLHAVGKRKMHTPVATLVRAVRDLSRNVCFQNCFGKFKKKKKEEKKEERQDNENKLTRAK